MPVPVTVPDLAEGAAEGSVSGGPWTTDDGAGSPEGSQSNAPRAVELLGWAPVADPQTGLAARVAGIGPGNVPWTSERIVAVQGPRGKALRDAAGVAIELKGRVDGKAAVRNGCTAGARKAFRDGFPAGWAGMRVGRKRKLSRDVVRRDDVGDDDGDGEGYPRAVRRRSGAAASTAAASMGLRTTRAGRVVLPVLDYWRSETMRYDREGKALGYERGFEERIVRSPPAQATASFVTRREALEAVGAGSHRLRGPLVAPEPTWTPTPKKTPKAKGASTARGKGRKVGRPGTEAGKRSARAALAETPPEESSPPPVPSPPASPPGAGRLSRLRRGGGAKGGMSPRGGKGKRGRPRLVPSSRAAPAAEAEAPVFPGGGDLRSEGADYVWSD